MEKRAGRGWRSLQDTADEAQILYYSPAAWASWRRSVDFYPEGELLWLDVDTTIREMSGGRHSLDDFAKAFYGMENGSFSVKPYTFDDVVATLNRVQENDWAAFLRQRLDSTDPAAPLGGIARSGWKLVYTDTPSQLQLADEKVRKYADVWYSLGIMINEDKHSGTLVDVLWNSPAFVAGLAPGMRIVAVNGEAYDPERIKEAVKAAKGGSQPIELIVQNLDSFSTIKIDYHEGTKYPQLSRVAGTPDRLDEIIKARK
jgi:predicted metalloprotease with PDZ domain